MIGFHPAVSAGHPQLQPRCAFSHVPDYLISIYIVHDTSVDSVGIASERISHLLTGYPDGTFTIPGITGGLYPKHIMADRHGHILNRAVPTTCLGIREQVPGFESLGSIGKVSTR
jgi:hypothetical protein